MKPTSMLVRVRSESLRERVLDLLCSAGRDRATVERWFADHDLWAMVDPVAVDVPLAAAIATRIGSRLVEIRVVHPIDGVDGARLLASLTDRYRTMGVRHLRALISDSELSALDALLRTGYRVTHVEPAACDLSRGWNDEPHDGLWLQLDL